MLMRFQTKQILSPVLLDANLLTEVAQTSTFIATMLALLKIQIYAERMNIFFTQGVMPNMSLLYKLEILNICGRNQLHCQMITEHSPIALLTKHLIEKKGCAVCETLATTTVDAT